MGKKLLILAISFALAITLLCAWYFHFFPFKNPYAQIPVKFTSSRIPYVEIEINSQKFFLEIDSGSDFELSVKKEIIEKINGRFTGKIFHQGSKGNESESSKYLIPKIKMGKVNFNNTTAHDGYTDEGGHIWGKKKHGDVEISGTIGRKLLGISNNLLLDFKNAVFFLIRTRKDLKHLRKEGYFVENLIEIPFEGDKNRIIFLVDTDVGEKKFLLDTGATVSIIKPSFVTEEERKEIRQHMMFMTTSKFVITNHDFGGMELHFYDIPDKFDDIDGILGMDFCRKHVIYLDFKEKKAFIGPSEKVHPDSK